jgi:hypothetical protein
MLININIHAHKLTITSSHHTLSNSYFNLLILAGAGVEDNNREKSALSALSTFVDNIGGNYSLQSPERTENEVLGNAILDVVVL